MAPLTTLKSITSQRVRHPMPPAQFYPKKQQQEANVARQEKQDAITAAVDEWHSYTVAKADELANRFDMKKTYFLNMFFQGGQKMVYQHTKTNAHNAFISLKAAELRADGDKENAVKIQTNFAAEYAALTETQHDELIADFESMKKNGLKLRRPTARGCIQDVANVSRNIELLLNGLKDRVGIEGFFCIVRNNVNYHLNPVWYFTTREIAEYMHIAVGRKWDASSVASKLEAFSIAGCDIINLNRTSQQKAHHMKREITDLIGQMLVKITGNPKATMKYVNFEEAIVQKYGINLIGWTHEKFACPSDLSNALGPLRTLLNAIKNGTCKFVELSPPERKARAAQYEADLASGKLVRKARKRRSDAGKKHKGTKGVEDVDEEEDEFSDDEEDARPRKRVKSRAVIEDSDIEVSSTLVASTSTN